MTVKPSKLLSGVDVFEDRTSLEQIASEIVGFNTFEHRMRDLYIQASGIGWDSEAMNLEDYNVLPEFLMPWYPGMIHQMYLEREGWFPLAGQHIRLCERGRFSNRFEAYDYLAQGERPVCLVSSARYWGLRLHSDTPADIERLKAAGQWRIG